MSIQPLPASSVHQISSGQVVPSLQSAVKELLENALDAGASSIEIRLVDHGTTSIEVIDNGSGIPGASLKFLGKRSCTSKLDVDLETPLDSIRTFGFRGEALNSLVAICERVSVTTATVEDAPLGNHIDDLARCIEGTDQPDAGNDANKANEKLKRVARQRGTTITLINPFHSLPVRRKELLRNSKREYMKVLTLCNAYALVPCSSSSSGVRLSISNQAGKASRSTTLLSPGPPSSSLQKTISNLWGPKIGSTLEPLNFGVTFTVGPSQASIKSKSIQRVEKEITLQIKGLISSPANANHGRTTNDRQFLYINSRPADSPKVQKVFNEVYRSFTSNPNTSPVVIADFILPTDSYDVNVSPDKRTILIHSEWKLVEALKVALEEHFDKQRGKFSVSTSSGVGSDSPLRTSQKSSSQQRKTRSSDSVVDLTLDSDMQLSELDTVGDQSIEEGRAGSSNLAGFNQTTMDLDEEDTNHTASSGPGLEHSKDYTWKLNGSDGYRRWNSAPQSKPRTTHEISITMESKTLGKRSSSRREIDKVASRSSGGKDQGQTVLSTSGASWNLSKTGESSKRRKVDLLDGGGLKKFGFGKTRRAESDLDSDKLDEEDEEDEGREDPEGLGEEEVEGEEDTGIDVEDGSEVDELEGDASIDTLPEESDEPETLPDESFERDVDITVDSSHADEDTRDEVPLFLPQDPEPSSEDIRSSNSYSSQHEINTRSDPSQHVPSGNLIPSSEELEASVPAIEVLRMSTNHEDVRLRFNLSEIKKAWQPQNSNTDPTSSDPSVGASPNPIDFSAGIKNVASPQSAERELSRVIQKTDFASMEILGQFNRGFIIARSRKSMSDASSTQSDDLFIIDQHASDEKYNFETLQLTTKIQSQKLLQPRPLELGAAEELIALDHVDILQKNGFEIAEAISASMDSDENERRRVNLVAMPVSKSTTFDMKDLEELIHLLRQSPPGTANIRCSKARAMFASRACRKSVMIGMHLPSEKMKKVVRNMGTIEQPWNCPHGRPTMRHLICLRDLESRAKLQGKEKEGVIDWEAFQDEVASLT